MNLYDLIDGLLTSVEKIKGKLITGENWIQIGDYQSSIGVSQRTAATFLLSNLHNSPVDSANMSWIAIGPA